MEPQLAIIFKHFWVILILMVLVNALYLAQRAKTYIANDETLKSGYGKFLKWFLVINVTPWAIMGFGMISGYTTDLTEYINLSEMNPVVMIFIAYIVCVLLLGFWWIYLRGGAEFMERHKGLLEFNFLTYRKSVTARQIKLFYPFSMVWVFICIGVMWFIDFPSLETLRHP